MLLILVAFALGCKNDKVRAFLPGTYSNAAGGEYSRADDTLSFEPVQENEFRIHRRTGFNVIDNGKLGPRQYELEEWRAIYDEGTHTLTETRKGRLITVNPDADIVLVGRRKYLKIH